MHVSGHRLSHRRSAATIVPIVAALFVLPLGGLGCASHEAEAPPQRTASVSDIDARIKQIQANQGMPEVARQQVLKDLQRQRNEATKAGH